MVNLEILLISYQFALAFAYFDEITTNVKTLVQNSPKESFFPPATTNEEITSINYISNINRN